MNQSEDSNNQQNNGKHQKPHARRTIIQSVVIAIVCLGIAVGGLTIASRWLNTAISDRVQFVTANLLNVLIFAAIVAQVLIYRKQRDIMSQQQQAMVEGLERTAEVNRKMAEQLDVVREQTEIMRKQAKSMDESVVFGLRAYVGIHSIGINFLTNRLSIQVENIGKVPAKDVKVDVQMEVAIPPKCMPEGYDQSRGAYVFTTKMIPFHYGEAKLFPGNLNIKIIVPIRRWLSEGLTDEQIHMISQGDARLIVRGNINFCDGFNADKNTPFALRFSPKADCWLPSPILSPEEARKSVEEQPYYED